MKLRKMLIPLMVASLVLCSCGSSSGDVAENSAAETGNEQSEAPASEEIKEETEETVAETETDETGAEETEAAPEAEESDVPEDNGAASDEKGFKVDAEKIDLSGVNDTEAAGIFKDFLTGETGAEYENDSLFLGDLLAISLEESDYDSNTDDLNEYLEENFAISYLVSETDKPTLYLEIMNVMQEGTVYQIRIKDKAPYVNSVLDTGWSDSVTVYKNGIVGIYHGMSMPTVDHYFSAEESLIDIFDGKSKAKLLIFGPKSYFDTGFEEALAEYEKQAETVLVFDEEITDDITAKRDELLGISDNDAIEWNRI